MTSRRKEIFFVALCVVFSALFTIGCSDSLLHPAQDGARILVQLENSSLRSGDTPSPAEKWQGNAWIENRDGSESHHQKISSAADEFSITFENVVVGSEIKICLDMTSTGDTPKRYTGSSNWKKIIDGVNVIVIVLKEVGVDAATPLITKQPEGETMTFAAGGTEKITKKLMVEASVSDGGTLTYQWYSNNTNSTEGGTPIEDANSNSYEASVPAGETKYFYCIVINTNNNVSGNKTASVTSNVVSLASIEGSLDSITAIYKGEYLLVGESSTNFTVTENYSDGNSVVISSIDGLYTVDVPENSIGYVPVTVTHNTHAQINTTFTIPVKYQLDPSYLTLNGSTSVEQNRTLQLTANYPDTTYQIYDGNGGPTTYQVKDNLYISWKDATAQDDAWEAMAETSNAGTGKTATVTLTPKDEWCVTTGGITASHEYEVTAATTVGGITDENSLLEAINQAQDGDSITIPNEITITNTITVNKNIIIDGNKTGTLFRSNKGTITGPMFEVSNSGNLTLQNITLDGQNNNAGQNNPLIYNKGTVILNNTTLQKNYMLQASTYGGTDFTGGGAIYSSGTLNITNSTITDITANGSSGGSVFIEKGEVNIQSSTINRDQQENKSVILGKDTSAFNSISYNINGVSTLVRSLDYDITPDNPSSPSTYSIGGEYLDDSRVLKGYVFEVNDSYIKIVATNHSWDYSWCGYSSNITDWGAVSTITDGQAMYNKMAENPDVIDNVTTIFYYAKTQKNETDSGWYIPTKDELNAVFNMNKTHQKVSGLSGDYWSSSIASITGDYTAYYVSIADDGTISSGTAAVDAKKKVIVVKKIDL